MIDEANARRVESWIDEARRLGAEVLLGGKRQGRARAANRVDRVPRAAKLDREEAFGPTVNLERVAELRRGDRPRQRLRLRPAVRRVHARPASTPGAPSSGSPSVRVIVNDAPSYRIDHMPYGGVKDSGFGREGIRCAIEDMTELRLLVLAMPPEPAFTSGG